jgi:hypothetical protein
MFPKVLACGGPLSKANQEAALSQWGEYPDPDVGHSMDKKWLFPLPKGDLPSWLRIGQAKARLGK